MFVYSMRASTLKFFGVIILSVITLIILIAFIPTIEPSSNTVITANQKINYANIKTNEDRIAFLSQFGHKVRPEPADEQEITIPGVFDRVMMEYNTLQKQQGFDLSKYERKNLTRYTYIVENYNGYDGTVYANILVFRGKVVGGDICSADINGFVDEL